MNRSAPHRRNPNRLSVEQLEDRTVPTVYGVTLLSPEAGEPGETVATHAGELRLTSPDLRGITVAEAATPEDAVRRTLTGTITATVGSQSARYAFGPGT
ncbi:MAG TPA: hypothetical protein VFG68_17275, partial [Fimbriiglobus sp.]|nr:hypothetical protein [Fimbriiglobus sp.]